MQGKDWLLTVWKHTESEDVAQAFISGFGEQVNYAVGQLEEAPDTGRRHIQLFVQFRKRIRLSGINGGLGLSSGDHHSERRRGTVDEAIAYCSKSDSRIAGPWYFGERPSKTGQRNDLESACNTLREHKSLKRLAEEFPTAYVKYQRGFKELLHLIGQTRDYLPKTVIVYWGEPGSGKTRTCFEAHKEDIWFAPPPSPNCWFDGYAGEETVIIDDYNPVKNDEKAFKNLLQMLHEYPFQMNVKNSSVWFVPKTIVITSQNPPWFYFSNDPNICMKSEEGLLETFKTDVWLRQLMRRIDWVERLETPADELVFPILINV